MSLVTETTKYYLTCSFSAPLVGEYHFGRCEPKGSISGAWSVTKSLAIQWLKQRARNHNWSWHVNA